MDPGSLETTSNSINNAIQQILRNDFPSIAFEMCQDGEVLTLQSTERRNVIMWGLIWNKINESISVEDLFMSGIAHDLDLGDGTVIDDKVYYIIDKTGKITFLTSKELYEKIQPQKLRLKSLKIRQLLLANRETWENFEEENLAAGILAGEIRYLLPVISGLKPACFLGEESEEFHQLAQKLCRKYPFLQIQKPKDIPESADVDVPEDGKIVLLNRDAVGKMAKEKAEVFGNTDGHNLKAVALRMATDTEFAGQLLGFDSKSAKAFAKGNMPHPRNSFYNIWQVAFCVADINDEEYKKLDKNYRILQELVELYLKDHPPSLVLDLLQNVFLVQDIQDVTRSAIASNGTPTVS